MPAYLDHRQRLICARARHLHTVPEAARAAGVGLTTWKRAEAGSMPHRAAVLGRIAAYVGCDPGDLIGCEASASDDAAQADAPLVTGSSVPVSHGR